VGVNETDSSASADPSASPDPVKRPLQRFPWWNYGVKPGDTVKHQVTPVVGCAGSLELNAALASDPTEELMVTSQFSVHNSAFFNKGVMAAQWVTRGLDREAGGATQTGLRAAVEKPGYSPTYTPAETTDEAKKQKLPPALARTFAVPRADCKVIIHHRRDQP
jgi:hypothetical protein